jgi:hypothetical protein
MRSLIVLIVIPAIFIIAGLPIPGLALDHKNLDEGRPLLVQDPYPIAAGKIAIEAGIGFLERRQASDKILFPLQIIYGVLPNFHVEVGTNFFTDPHEGGINGHSGDLTLAVLHNFNKETLALPALGIKGSAVFPTGIGSSGVDLEVMGLLMKSLYRLSFYLNGGYEFKAGRGSDERMGRYKFIVGASYPIGAPLYTRLLLLSDLFLLQAERRHTNATTGGEIGVRYQFTERVVVDAGIGTTFSGPKDRSSFLAKTGFSLAF